MLRGRARVIRQVTPTLVNKHLSNFLLARQAGTQEAGHAVSKQAMLWQATKAGNKAFKLYTTASAPCLGELNSGLGPCRHTSRHNKTNTCWCLWGADPSPCVDGNFMPQHHRTDTDSCVHMDDVHVCDTTVG